MSKQKEYLLQLLQLTDNVGFYRTEIVVEAERRDLLTVKITDLSVWLDNTPENQKQLQTLHAKLVGPVFGEQK